MSSVNISALGSVKPSQAPQMAPPKAPKPKFVLAPAGEYKLRITTPVNNDTLKVSTTGNLNFKFDAQIVEGPFAGQNVRFQNASAATWERDGVTQSMLGNLVAALGGTFPGIGDDGDPTPQVQALEAVIGNTFTAYVTWRAEDRKFGTGIKVTGPKNFPTGEDGQPLSYIPLPGHVDAQGREARAWANLEIGNYVAAR